MSLLRIKVRTLKKEVKSICDEVEVDHRMDSCNAARCVVYAIFKTGQIMVDYDENLAVDTETTVEFEEIFLHYIDFDRLGPLTLIIDAASCALWSTQNFWNASCVDNSSIVPCQRRRLTSSVTSSLAPRIELRQR